MQWAEPSKVPPKTNLVRLRAHHMLCALTFRSRGYGPDFISHFESIIDSIMKGDPIQLIAEPDDLCNSNQNCGACSSPVSRHRDQLAIEALELVHPNLAKAEIESLTDTDLLRLRAAFADGSARAACEACSWFDICSGEAKNNFRRARLQPRS